MTSLIGLMRERKRKMEALKEKGIEPYGYSYDRRNFSEEITKDFKKHEGKKVSIAGRIVSLRTMGKISFGDLQDAKGTIQFSLRKDELEEFYDTFVDYFERGDIVGIKGKVYKTRRGEITVGVEEVKMLAKSLRPLPEKWHGLKDRETKYRQRYVDLIMNKESRHIFMIRSKFISAIRKFLENNGFVEVETPILQPIYGGAMATPFETYHNELKRKMYLRISDELYLKRLIVGGMEKVFEIGKDFRNEGIDTTHNPEFTQMELYVAYMDYNGIMDLTEKLLRHSIKKAIGKTKFEYQGNEIDVSKEFDKISMVEKVSEHIGKNVFEIDEKELKRVAKKEGIDSKVPGKIIEDIFSKHVQPNLIQPTFVMDFPVDISPLAKKKRNNDKVVERFELYIGGEECGNAFSELNNPLEQYQRFKEQEKLRRSRKDLEAQPMDKDYVRALEYGMPPTGGLGLGIDRLVMVITGNPSIRKTVLFPALKKTKKFKVLGEIL